MEIFTDQQLGPLTAQNIRDVLSSVCGCTLPLNVLLNSLPEYKIQHEFDKLHFIAFLLKLSLTSIVGADLVSDLPIEKMQGYKMHFLKSVCGFDGNKHVSQNVP